MTKKGEKNKKVDPSKRLENPKWELFCYLFSGYHNRKLFGNATHCLLEAFGHNETLAKLESHKIKLLEQQPPGYIAKTNKVKAEQKRIYNVANAESSRLLVNPKVRGRCDYLLSEYLDNETIDRELVFVATQRTDLASKVQAIKEYNRVKARVSDKLEGEFEFTWAGENKIRAKSK